MQNFTTEYIVWARKYENVPHYFNCELMEILNGGVRMSDVWKIPFVASWVMVMVNHARKELKQKMVEKGICYLRAGDSKGSLLVTPGFERMQYVLLHTNGKDCQLFRLKSKGTFQIWTADTLCQYGFSPTHAPYYIGLFFNPKNPIEIIHQPNLMAGSFTYSAKIRPLSDFIGIK